MTDWREIAQRMWDGDYASVDELAQAMAAEAGDEIERLKLIRDLLIKSLAVAIGVEETDAALLTGPLTAAMKFRAALTTQEPADRPRDDGTEVAVGGEPGASAGKSE